MTKTAEEIAAMRSEVEAYEAAERQKKEAEVDKLLKPVFDLLASSEFKKTLIKLGEVKATVRDHEMLYNLLNNIEVSANLLDGQLQRTRSSLLG
jgi:hypothetical protein